MQSDFSYILNANLSTSFDHTILSLQYQFSRFHNSVFKTLIIAYKNKAQDNLSMLFIVTIIKNFMPQTSHIQSNFIPFTLSFYPQTIILVSISKKLIILYFPDSIGQIFYENVNIASVKFCLKKVQVLTLTQILQSIKAIYEKMPGGSDNQTTIKRTTKIKQKHKLHDPTLLQTNPVLVPQVGTTGLTTGTSGLTKNRSSSSSSSSSSSNGRQRQGQQKQGLGTNMTEGLTGGNQMGQGSMGPGMSNQGYSQGMQSYPNTGISGTGYSGGGMGTMPMNQQGELPSTKTTAKNETKMTFVQKVKEKLTHHGQK